MSNAESVNSSMRTLVTYAFRYGSTKEVAEYLARILDENGFSPDLRPMREVRDIQEYDNVVLGAPF
jgi:menaquinone-dependent protoporphyrinogen oxidase